MELDIAAHHRRRVQADEVGQNTVVADRSVDVNVDVRAATDVGCQARSSGNDATFPEQHVTSDGGLRMDQRLLPAVGFGQSLGDLLAHGAGSDTDDVGDIHPVQDLRRTNEGGSSAAESVEVHLAVVDKADELDDIAHRPLCLDDVEHLATKAPGTDDDDLVQLVHRTRRILVTMKGAGAQRSAQKRAFDLALGFSAFIAALPLIAASALAVRVTMGRGVWFRQERAGLDGRPITVLKLRTMSNDRDSSGQLLSDDRRLTRLGRFLRGTSLDELPQLLNVLRGDMALVGPRPLPMAYVERYSPEERRRLDVKPGITGWAQINGRNAISWPEKLRLDVWYVDNTSLRLDLRIVLLTIKTVLTGGGGISAEGHATMPEFTGEP